MSLLSASTRASLSDLRRSFEQAKQGPNALKAKRVFSSRQQHWIKWLKSHHIFDPSLSNNHLLDRNYILALYALSLTQGNTILAISIKSDTLDRYLYAAASFGVAKLLPDPRYNHLGKKSYLILRVT